ncbi:S8 family peptidase [Actinoplanes subglobosus]|uniref:S8 family serine peptidase n=1 Tax=Actinoplanes subglobosus TaxID=1547892 RepID=A0ABV8IZV7_9ACTN
MPGETSFPNPWALDPRVRRTGNTYYMANEILVAADDAPMVRGAMRGLGAQRSEAPDGIDEYVHRYVLPDTGDDPPAMTAVVGQLRATGNSPRVGLNHVFAANGSIPISGQPKLHGGTATDPAPAPNPQVSGLATDSRVVRVAVIDTGLDPAALTLPVFYQHARHGRHEPDTVYENPAVRRIGLMGGHGTAAAGIIARYARRAHLTSIQVLNVHGICDEWTLAAGILRARDAGAEIISMSLGGTYVGDEEPLALKAVLDDLPAGTVVVAAAGNVDAATPNFYPASRPGVVSVAAIDTTDPAGTEVPAAFSNTGDWITACAPGVRVHAPYVFGTWNYGANPIDFTGAVAWSGTSFAAPFVAAQIAANTTLKETCAEAADRLLGGLSRSFPGYGRYVPAPPGFILP